MAKPKFHTDRQVANLKPIDGKPTDYSHSKLPGFMLRVGAKKKVWKVRYRIGGKLKTYSLPIPYPECTLEVATKEYHRIRADANKSVDPLGEKIERKAAPIISEVMEHYFEETDMAPKTRAESIRMSNKDIVPFLGDLKAIDLTRQDVKKLHKKILDRGATVAANRTIELLRRAFNCAEDEEFITSNPFPSIKKIKAVESPRERILKDFEIKALWAAMENEASNQRDLLRLLLLLGQRTLETASMQIDDLDLDRKEWTVPGEKTKTGKPNVVPLPPLAWSIIENRLVILKEKFEKESEKAARLGKEPPEQLSWIFPSRHNTTRKGAKGDGHTKSTKDSRRRLKKATSIEGWTAHDLRRTCRTIMSREKVLTVVGEQVLGHVQSGVEGIYDQHTYIEEKAAALLKVENAIRKIVGLETESGKVVPLRRMAG